MECDGSAGSDGDRSTSHLESILKELASYKHAGDMPDMSPEVQALLRRAEQSQQREECRRLRGRPPRQPGRPGRVRSGGSLDTMAGTGRTTSRGVAARTAEGGSCFNLSCGSFEPGARRPARLQQGRSLEDLSAIEETAGAAEGGRSGGSLQNLSQQPDQTGTAPHRAVVIDMGDQSEEEEAARSAVRALAAPCSTSAGEEWGTGLSELRRRPAGPPTVSLEEGGGALQQLAAASAQPDTITARQGRPGGHRASSRQQAANEESSETAKGVSYVLSDGGRIVPVTFASVSAPSITSRRGQTAEPGSGRTDSSRTAHRKHRRKEDPRMVKTEEVENYQGNRNVEDLIQFIESGDRKAGSAAEKPARRVDRRKEVKSRKVAAEERAARAERRQARRTAARRRSLQSRPAAGGLTHQEHSTVCRDPAQTPSQRFVHDFYSVATDSPVAEESDFLVVTRRRRRRRGNAGRAGPERAPPPGRRPPAASHSAPNSDTTSDSESDGAASLPAGRAAAAAAAAGRAGAGSVSSTQTSVSAASWAEVAGSKAGPRSTAAGASTDFICGVGDLFCEPAAPPGLVRGASEPPAASIAGTQPEPPAPSTDPAPARGASPAAAAADASAVRARQSVSSGARPGRRAPPVQIPGSALPAADGAAPRALGIQFGYIEASDVSVADRVTTSPSGTLSPTNGAKTRCGDGLRTEEAKTQPEKPNVAFPAVNGAVSPPSEGASSRSLASTGGELQSWAAGQEPIAVPSGVDRFCRRFRPQPVDVSQFNWKEISVFLSKVYAEAVIVPGSFLEEAGRVSVEARR